MNLSTIVSFIYPFLTDYDLKSLYSVSKVFRASEYKRRYFEGISGFVLKHFDIIQASLDVSRLSTLFFQDRSIYILGENHSIYLHRYLNAQIINLLFNERARILGEGSLESIQEEIAFVDNAFHNRVSGWDGHFPELNASVFEIIKMMEVAKSFHIGFPFGDKVDFFSLSDFINKTLPTFKGAIFEMEEIQNWDELGWGSEEKLKALGSLYSKISDLLYEHLSDLYHLFDKRLLAYDQKREHLLVSKIKEAESTVFVIAGADHVGSSIVKRGVKGSPHLLIQPKERLDWQTVFEDLSKRFPEKSFMSIGESSSKELSPIKRDDVDRKERIFLLKKQFIQFNFDWIGRGPNHFDYWFRVLMTILKWDSRHPLTISHIIQLEAHLKADYYQRIASFVSAYFEIIYCSHSLELVLQEKNLVIGLGESHLYETDKYLNGLLTYLIPSPGRSLYCEGGNAVKPERLKYVNTSGHFKSDSWDRALPSQFFDIVRNIKIALDDVGNFFSDFPDDPRATYEEVKEFVEDWISVAHRDSIMAIDAVKALKNKHLNERQRSHLIDEVYRRLAHYYYNYLKGLDETCDEQLKLFGKQRNQGIVQAALNVRGAVFINAGHIHFETDYVLKTFKGINALIVKPKRNIDMDGLINYLRVHFSRVPLPKFEGDTRTVESREELHKLIDSPKLSLEEIRDLKQKLIDFDSDDLDFGENHFDLWLQIALIVLKSSAT